jgi:hypothetical protein
MNSRQHRPGNTQKTRPSYVQALEKAMDTLWTPEAVRQTRELAEQIHISNTEHAA